MGISIAHQTRCFLMALLVGAGLGLLLDGFRFLRLLLPCPRWLVGLEDILCCLLMVYQTLRFLLWANQGEIRSFILVGEALGMVLYLVTASPLVIRLLRPISRWLKGVGTFLWKGICLKILRLLTAPAVICIKNFKKLRRRHKFALKRKAILLYNLSKSVKASDSFNTRHEVK